MKQFNIPVVLFLFKRIDSLDRIFSVLRQIQAKKIYLLADGPRTELEAIQTSKARNYAVELVDWECELITDFAETNLGIKRRIGEGAMQIFAHEKEAIFLEDDNLPALSFFRYCKEMLDRYSDDEDVLWVCGTNYLEEYEPACGASYMFTQHMLPCGWASWGSKFKKYYDVNLDQLTDLTVKNLEAKYSNRAVYRQDIDVFRKTKRLIDRGDPMASWDRQIGFSLRHYNKLGISPKYNQIRNIGADRFSTHGGNSLKKEMTNRFCELETRELSFPLVHPRKKSVNSEYDSLINKIILLPLRSRIAVSIGRCAKPLMGLHADDSLALWMKKIKSRLMLK